MQLSCSSGGETHQAGRGKDISDDDPFSRRPITVTHLLVHMTRETIQKVLQLQQLRGPQRMLQQRQEKKSTKKKKG